MEQKSVAERKILIVLRRWGKEVREMGLGVSFVGWVFGLKESASVGSPAKVTRR